MRAGVLASALLLCPALVTAQTTGAQTPSPAPLPVRRVVLYKTGVGFFEHQGQVRGNQRVTIRFTSRQLNDVLKSLTTIDPKGRISGITYNSMAPLEQRLGALRLPLTAESTAFDLMGTLRGARVEVAGIGAPFSGRLFGVERKIQVIGDRKHELQELSVVTDLGTVRSFELTPAVKVRVVERDMRQEVGRYLDVIGSTREQDVRNVVIATTGAGERPLFVSYVSEVPIWKSTYRLVLPAGRGSSGPFLQGWAVIDNTVGEDWTNVELSLVAGAPQSFIQRLSQPYYRERPVLPIPTDVVTEPQTHQAGLTPVEGPRDYTRAIGGPPAYPHDAVGGVPGGAMGGVVGGMPEAPMSFEALRDIQPAAQPSDLGDLYEYRITEPVTLRRNQSALVPIINAGIGVEKVSLWNKGAASGHPLRALWLTNTTGMTLDGGSVTVIDGNAFAGEGLIESLAPSAKRLISYGEDLGVIVTGSLKTGNERVVRVRAVDGILIRETLDRADWTYAIRNEETMPATIVVEHRLRKGWSLAEGQAVEEMAPGAPRFKITLAGSETRELVVREVRRGEAKMRVDEITDAVVVQLTRSGVPAQALNAALMPVVMRRTGLAAAERRLADLAADEARITADQARLRENMKALRGTSEEKLLLQRYTRQLDDQETRIEALRQAIARAKAEADAARAELMRAIATLKFDI